MDYSRTTRQFSKEELAALSQSDSQNLVYDISRMDPRDFYPLIRAISQYGKKHIFSLTFTLDYFYEYCWTEYPTLKSNEKKKTISKKRNIIPFTLANSAYRKIPNTIHVLVSMLSKLLPTTVTLITLKFRSIVFKPRDRDKLITAINGNTSLRKLYFENVNILDEGMGLLMKSLRHPAVTVLSCRHCGLSDISISAISEYLTYHMLLQLKADKYEDNFLKSVCLVTLDLRDNDFSTKFLAAISDTIADFPISLVDVRNNTEFDERIVSNMRRSAPHVEIRTGHDRTTFAPTRKQKNINGNDDTIDDNDNINLDNDNNNNINDNENEGEEIVLSPDIRIKGSRAKEFVGYLEQIIKLGEELQKIQELRSKGDMLGGKNYIKKKKKGLKKKKSSKLKRMSKI